MAQPAPYAHSLWIEGAENVITKGALMNFENQNGLTVDGLAGTRVWSALLADLAANKVERRSLHLRLRVQTAARGLTLFENGTPTLVNIPVNTGRAGRGHR